MEHAMTQPVLSLLDRARIEALFASDLSMSATTNPEIVRDAIRSAVRRHGGARGCAGIVAEQFGDHPDTAVPRMRWAYATIAIWYINTRGACSHYCVVPPRLSATLIRGAK
jgi:hypothetical protein